MNIQVTKVIENNEPQYTIQMDRQSFWALQRLLCLANNKITAHSSKTNSGLSTEDELLLVTLSDKMMKGHAVVTEEVPNNIKAVNKHLKDYYEMLLSMLSNDLGNTDLMDKIKAFKLLHPEVVNAFHKPKDISGSM